MGKQRMCELCTAEAVAYCVADSAFLCLSCDARVHGANFLVARHVRKIVCSNCQDFTGDQISGLGSKPKPSICRICSPSELDSGELDSLSSSSSSACVSSAQSSSFCDSTRKGKRGGGIKSPGMAAVNGGQRARFGVDSKTVGIFVHWCKRFGLSNDVAAIVVRMACNGLGICVGKLTVLPFRVCLVASLWFGLKSSGIRYLSGSQALTRLEVITGLSAKLISGAESKIERLYRSAKQHDQLLKEDWAESS